MKKHILIRIQHVGVKVVPSLCHSGFVEFTCGLCCVCCTLLTQICLTHTYSMYITVWKVRAS